MKFSIYPLVNVYITMENHHFLWENPLFLWSFSIVMLVYQRVSTIINSHNANFIVINYHYYPIVIVTIIQFYAKNIFRQAASGNAVPLPQSLGAPRSAPRRRPPAVAMPGNAILPRGNGTSRNEKWRFSWENMGKHMKNHLTYPRI